MKECQSIQNAAETTGLGTYEFKGLNIVAIVGKLETEKKRKIIQKYRLNDWNDDAFMVKSCSNRNPGPGYNTLLFSIGPKGPFSCQSHRQLHTTHHFCMATVPPAELGPWVKLTTFHVTAMLHLPYLLIWEEEQIANILAFEEIYNVPLHSHAVISPTWHLLIDLFLSSHTNQPPADLET